jgi:hypothetical protein
VLFSARVPSGRFVFPSCMTKLRLFVSFLARILGFLCLLSSLSAEDFVLPLAP